MSDAFSNFNTLLLHMEGSNNSTIFTDKSSISNIISTYNDVKISTSQSKWGNGSAYFDGTGDYLGSSINLAIGTSDFTIECWIYITSLSSDGEIFTIGNVSNTSQFDIVFEYKTTGALRGSIQNGSGSAQLDITTPSNLIIINTWNHIAFTANGTTGKLWINGNESQSGTISGTRVQNRNDVRIGYLASSVPRWFCGYMQDLRITRGIARYTTNFTIPDTKFDDSDALTIRFVSNLLFFNIEDGGDYFIEGNVFVDSIPSSRKVRLCLLNNGRISKQTWSDPVTGYYKFIDLKDQEYYVWSEDYFSSQEKSMKVINNTSGNNFEFFSGNSIDVSASATRYYLTGNAKLRNGVKATQINVLSFPSGTFISSIIPELNGNYSIYLNKGSEYIFLFIGPTPYKPESYYYKAPA